jgi:hypothetical protein
VIPLEICQPNGNNQAGFPASETAHFALKARIARIRKIAIKNAPIRPVTGIWQKR